jgi:hypothetical protein
VPRSLEANEREGMATMDTHEAARSRDEGRRLIRRVTSLLAAGGLAVAVVIGVAGAEQKTVSTVSSTSPGSSSSGSSDSSSSSGSGTLQQPAQAPFSSGTSGAVTSGGS